MCLEKLIYASMYKSLCIKLDQLHNLSLLGLHLQGYLNITYLTCIMCVQHGITPQVKMKGFIVIYYRNRLWW